MYLPKPLYEAIPYLYTGIGVVAVVIINSPVAIFSGILLIYAGWLVHRTRRDFRTYLSDKEEARSTGGHEEGA